MVILFPLLTFGNCECEDCLDECECGNNSLSQECIDCVTECEPTNNCYWPWIVLGIVGLFLCGCCCFMQIKKTSTAYKYGCILIFSFLFGIIGTIYFWSCDCDDLTGCNDYEIEFECPAFGGEDCQWSDGECINIMCYCCSVDITKKVRNIFGSIFSVVTFVSFFGFIFWVYRIRKADKRRNKERVDDQEMDNY